MSNKIKARKAGYPAEGLLQFMGLNSIFIHNWIKIQCFSCSTVLQPNLHIDFCCSITPLFTSAVWRPVSDNLCIVWNILKYRLQRWSDVKLKNYIFMDSLTVSFCLYYVVVIQCGTQYISVQNSELLFFTILFSASII